MADDGKDSQQRTSNLARIRDNQRRSRARRKEYLQELETKYRSCEQLGVEASAEIQVAARRVVDENRRLRQLLVQQGLSEADIDAVQQSNPADANASTTANELEALLNVRKPCRPDDGCGSGSNAGNCGPPTMRPTLMPTPSAAKMRPISRSPSVQTNTGSSSTATGSVRLSPAQKDSLSPNSSTGYIGQTEYTAASHSFEHQPQHAALYPMGEYSDMPYDDLDATLEWPDDFAGDITAMEGFMPLSATTNDAHSLENDASSCATAAAAIRAYNPHVNHDLSAELGCCGGDGDGDGGDDCYVSNSRVFSIMDRYSSNNLGHENDE